MTGAAVAVVLGAADSACRAAGAALFPGVPYRELGRQELRPPAPFTGVLFDLLAALPGGSVAGLVVPVVVSAALPGAAPNAAAPTARPQPGDLVPVADHVNLEGRGPLTGPWPVGVSRDFPNMNGVYQPSLVRPFGGARVYSSGVVAAGVADTRRLTRFEARAVRQGGWPIVSDSLVPAAVVAAYYGVKLAVCGVVQTPLFERE